MDEIEANLQEIAGILGVSDRTVQRWHGEGLPRHGEGRGARYPVARVVAWVRTRDREQLEREIFRSPVPDLDEARARKEMALARLREYDLAQREGVLIHVDDVIAERTVVYTALRGILLAIPGKYAYSFLGTGTLVEAQCRLDAMVRSVMTEMVAWNDDRHADADMDADEAA